MLLYWSMGTTIKPNPQHSLQIAQNFPLVLRETILVKTTPNLLGLKRVYNVSDWAATHCHAVHLAVKPIETFKDKEQITCITKKNQKKNSLCFVVTLKAGSSISSLSIHYPHFLLFDTEHILHFWAQNKPSADGKSILGCRTSNWESRNRKVFQMCGKYPAEDESGKNRRVKSWMQGSRLVKSSTTELQM